LQEHLATTAARGCIECAETRGAPSVGFAQQGKLEEHWGSGCGKVDRESRIRGAVTLGEAPLERRAHIAEMLAQRVRAAGVFQIDLSAVTRIEQLREIFCVAPSGERGFAALVQSLHPVQPSRFEQPIALRCVITRQSRQKRLANQRVECVESGGFIRVSVV
jgi:hypothetical protein